MSKSSNRGDQIIYSRNDMCGVAGAQGEQRRLMKQVGASYVRLKL